MKPVASLRSLLLVAAWLPVLFAGLVTAQTNLLQNPEFNTLAPDASLPPWTLSGAAHAVVSNPDAEADFGVRLRPTIPGGQAAVLQEITLDAPLAGPTRVRFAASVRRGGGSTMLPQVSIDPGGEPPVTLAPTFSTVALDGAFHQVQWTGVLPGLPAAFTLAVTVTAGIPPNDEWQIDNADLRAGPMPLQVNPSAVAPGQGIQIAHPAIGPGWQAFIGGQPADIVMSAPGQLVCSAPPPPPGYNPHMFLPVQVFHPPTSQSFADPAAFTYRLPMATGDIEPIVASAAGGTRVHIAGQNFRPDLMLTDLSTPSRPPFAPDLIESAAGFWFVVPPTAPPQVDWRITSPSAPGFAAEFSLLVEDPPLLEALHPDNGPPAGGTLVTITGAGFAAGAVAVFDEQPALSTVVASESEIHALTAPHQMESVAVTVVNPSGVGSPGPGVFTYLEGVRADVNGDGRADPEDTLLALDAVLSAVSATPLNPDADVDGNARIGLAEAVAALNQSETGSPAAAFIDPPTLVLSSVEAVAGEEVFGLVTSGQAPHDITILWGDENAQPITEAQGGNPIPHIYPRPGTYQARLLWSQGFTDPVTITILPQPLLTGARMNLTGTAEDGSPVDARSGRIDPAAPGTLEIGLDATNLPAAGIEVSGVVQLTGPGMAGRIDLPWQLHLVPVEGGAGSAAVDLSLPLAQLPAPGEFYTKLVITTAIGSNGAIPPAPVTFSLTGFVTEEEVHDLEREWREKRLAKAAKQNDCEELKKRLEECQNKKADLEAARDAAMAALDAIDSEIAATQAAYDALFASVNQFLAGVGSLATYPAGGGAPPGGQFIGARKASASEGVGISFDNAQALLDRMALYKKVNGHSIGKDLNTLRNQIAQLDALKAQKAAKEAEIADLNAQIAAMDAAIAAKQAALAACMDECDALEQEIKDLAEAHAEALEQLEKQRESEAGIGGSERRADELEDKPDIVDEAADNADSEIDGRAGTPGQVQEDKDKVEEGRRRADEAQDKIDEARRKQEEARDALEEGDTETADQKTQEANDLLDEATQDLRAGSDSIRSGRSSATGRQRRQCVDGEFVMGTPSSRVIWTRITDIAIVPSGLTPEKWASTMKNAQGVLDGLKDFFEFFGLIEEVTDRVGIDIPIGGTITPDPAETAQAIVNAWLEIFKMTQPYDVWAEISGHTKWNRTDRRCVNGLWTYEYVEWEDNDVVTRKARIGTIWGGDRASREDQLNEILKRPALPTR